MDRYKIVKTDYERVYFINWSRWLFFLILVLVSLPILIYSLGSNIGNVYLLHENPKEAESWFYQVTSRSDLPAAWRGLAEAAAKQGKLETALSAYDKSIKLRPNHLWARLGRADVRLSLGDLDSAISDWKSIHSTNALLWLGHQAMANKEWETTELFYQLVVEVAPDEWQGYYYLAAMLQHQERPEEAERLLQTGLTLSPNNTSIIFHLGKTHYALQNYDQAIRDLSRYIELKPSDFIGWYWRGLCWEAIDSVELALNDFEVAVDLNPSDPNPHFHLARNLEFLGDNESALSEYKKVLDILPDHGKSLVALKRLQSEP